MDAKMTIDTCNTAPDAVVVATHMEALDHATVTRSELREFAVKSNVDETRLLIPEDGQVLFF